MSDHEGGTGDRPTDPQGLSALATSIPTAPRLVTASWGVAAGAVFVLVIVASLATSGLRPDHPVAASAVFFLFLFAVAAVGAWAGRRAPADPMRNAAVGTIVGFLGGQVVAAVISVATDHDIGWGRLASVLFGLGLVAALSMFGAAFGVLPLRRAEVERQRGPQH